LVYLQRALKKGFKSEEDKATIYETLPHLEQIKTASKVILYAEKLNSELSNSELAEKIKQNKTKILEILELYKELEKL